VGPGDRVFCRPRTAILAAIAAALLVLVVLLKGSERDDAPRAAPRPPEPVLPGPERPVDAKPKDPRKRAVDRRPPNPRPPETPETRARMKLGVRVLDVTGKPRAGVPFELVTGAPGGSLGRVLEAARASDASGPIEFPWPKAAAGQDVFLSAAMILEEPLLMQVARGSPETVTITIPESGEVLVKVEGPDGRPFEAPVRVLALAAANDPWPDAPALERASTMAEGGRAKLPLVESGTLVLIEGRTADRSFAIAPKLVEGPASEGAVVETTLVARKRQGSDVTPPVVAKFVLPGSGPSAAGIDGAPRESGVRVTMRPKDALPQWPLVIQVGLRKSAGGALDRAARVDPRGTATIAAPPGRYAVACRLWRAMPDGWVTADAELVAPGHAPIDVLAGRPQAAEVTVDAQALAAAAAALMGW
jgi:hypothetical protein